MTQAATAVVRKQIVVEAPIERAFAVFTERFGDFKPPEHNLLAVADRRDRVRAAGRRPHLRPRQSTAASAGGRGSSPTSRPTGWCSAGTSARSGRSRPTRTTPARSRSGSSPRPRSAPGSSWSTATSTGTAPAGRPSRDGVAGDAGLAAVPGPVRRPVRRGQLNAADQSPPPRSNRPADDVFAYATDPTRFHEWQKGVVSGHMDEPGHPAVGAQCLTTRRIGGAERAGTSELAHIDPPTDLGRPWHRRADPGRRRRHRRARSTPTGPGSTIAVDFTGHGIGKVLVPLVVRREAAKEMPANLARLKARLESGSL